MVLNNLTFDDKPLQLTEINFTGPGFRSILLLKRRIRITLFSLNRHADEMFSSVLSSNGFRPLRLAIDFGKQKQKKEIEH